LHIEANKPGRKFYYDLKKMIEIQCEAASSGIEEEEKDRGVVGRRVGAGRQARMARGIYGLLKVSPGPTFYTLL
jgi:hypothetical protein